MFVIIGHTSQWVLVSINLVVWNKDSLNFKLTRFVRFMYLLLMIWKQLLKLAFPEIIITYCYIYQRVRKNVPKRFGSRGPNFVYNQVLGAPFFWSHPVSKLFYLFIHILCRQKSFFSIVCGLLNRWFHVWSLTKLMKRFSNLQ